MTIRRVLRLAQSHHESIDGLLIQALALTRVRYYQGWSEAIQQALVKNQESARHLGNIITLIEEPEE